jgi:hypothetical protein
MLKSSAASDAPARSSMGRSDDKERNIICDCNAYSVQVPTANLRDDSGACVGNKTVQPGNIVVSSSICRASHGRIYFLSDSA